MNRNYLIKNINLINLVLIVFIVFLGFKFSTVLKEPLNIPVITTTNNIKDTLKKPKIKKEKQIKPADYDIIFQKDLFRRSRSPKKEISKTPPTPPFPEGKPQLFGTIIMSDVNIAFIKEIDHKKTKAYSLGDKISSFVITDIQEDKVTIAKGDQSIQMKLMDSQKIREKESKKIRKKQKRVKRPNRSRKRRLRR